MSDSKQIFLVPLHDIKAFMKYLEGQGHDIDIIENTTLEAEWVNFRKVQIGAAEA